MERCDKKTKENLIISFSFLSVLKQTIKKVLPLFTSQKSGEIIVVSSLAGKIGFINWIFLFCMRERRYGK